jgi:hypothetical protein
MRLHESGRNPNTRKEAVPHLDLLLVGVDVSKAQHRACRGTQTTMSCRMRAFTPTQAGCRRFAPTRKVHLAHPGRPCLLLALAPAGLSGPARYERLHSWGDTVCLGPCQAVRPQRHTMPDGARARAACPSNVPLRSRPPTAGCDNRWL